MNDLVKNSIEGRKDAIYNTYNVTEQSIIDKIEDLFRRISEFGENCVDNMDFENKFAVSELNQEYIQLFTEIATTCTPVVRAVEEREVKSDAEYARDELESELRYQAKEATLPMRRKMRQEAYDEARDTPIIGDIMNVKQHIDFFSRFGKLRKKKKDKKEEEEKKQ